MVSFIKGEVPIDVFNSSQSLDFPLQFNFDLLARFQIMRPGLLYPTQFELTVLIFVQIEFNFVVDEVPSLWKVFNEPVVSQNICSIRKNGKSGLELHCRPVSASTQHESK